jgi:DNA-binding GntR family transcriptional regulator
MRQALVGFEPQRFTELNFEFHAALFEKCPNPHILDLVHRGWNRMKLLRESSFALVPGRAQSSVNEHERILALIAENAPEREIEAHAREHRLATLRAVLALQEEHREEHRHSAAA